MPKTADIAVLYKAVASREWKAVEAAALRIVAAEEAGGHPGAAATLRAALRGTAPRSHLREALGGDAVESMTLQHALSPAPPAEELTNLELTPSVRESICEIMAEWRARDILAEHHLRHRARLLFHGPPGCGKTATAVALARQMELPAYVVRFDAIIGAYLGQTSLRVRELFRFAEDVPCVLLLDEIDALGKQRGSLQDVGELDRVVIALMQQLELTRPSGLVIASTNLFERLDKALARRFDSVVHFRAPEAEELRRYVRMRLGERGLAVGEAVEAHCADVASYADAALRVDDVHRRSVLSLTRIRHGHAS